MTAHRIVNRGQWLVERRAHLEQEKAFTRARDELNAARRELPWVQVDKASTFSGESGELEFLELFGDHSQLLVYHFMYGPGWEDGCPSCSFWADNYNGVHVHLAHRDIALATVGRASIEVLQAYRRRMG
jgi:predicted dithiol-disulfide oxidoreductase (DUF899 family)